MSDGPVKAEFADRIDRLEELADAEREVQGLKTRFEQAQHEVVRSAEQLLEWQQLLGERRRAVFARYPDAVPVDKVLIDAQATIDRFCDEVRANNERFSIREPESRDHLIDAQTTDPVDPRIECASDEPDALAEFMKLPGAVKWGGGECPVPQSAVVEYLLRGADLPPLDPKPAFLLSWDHADILGDIIAYRVVSEPAEQYDDPTAVAIAAYIEAENEAPAPEQDASVEIEPGPSVAEVEYEDRRYSGEVDENGNPCGCGTIQYADGRLYAGEVNAQGQAHGAGVMQYPAGHPDMVEQDAALLPLHPEPSPYAEAIEKGAITQDEADFLVSERERIAADEQARFFAKGMMADADRHQSDQRGIVAKMFDALKPKVDA